MCIVNSDTIKASATFAFLWKKYVDIQEFPSYIYSGKKIHIKEPECVMDQFIYINAWKAFLQKKVYSALK